MWLLMRQCPLKHKECPLKCQLVGTVIRSLEIQVTKATNRHKNGSAGESNTEVWNTTEQYKVTELQVSRKLPFILFSLSPKMI